jgi:hypothetical protein
MEGMGAEKTSGPIVESFGREEGKRFWITAAQITFQLRILRISTRWRGERDGR